MRVYCHGAFGAKQEGGKMRVLIIEDEINAAEHLSRTLKKLRPSYEILLCIESVEEAVNWFSNNPSPDLVCMDIQLADGLSFEIFKHVSFSSPVIFTTAFDKYAIDAFKVNSIDYLLKPIHANDLAIALEKYEGQKLLSQRADQGQIAKKVSGISRSPKERCLIKRGAHFEFVKSADIAYIFSEDGLTFLRTFDGKKSLYSDTVSNLFEELDQSVFFQINRAQIVNVDAISKVYPFFNQRLKVQVVQNLGDQELLVSRSKVTLFKEWMNI